ncbi:MAG: phytanoyl-CoA dioxygenase family protein [Xanthomonadales bacterium]|nr:phytanoyl-CoA dioxygenase family protein [Xanthomonadales bacterium]
MGGTETHSVKDQRGAIATPASEVDSNRAEFRQQGYLVLPGLLDPAVDLAPLQRAYSELVDRLADHLCGRLLEQVIPNYAELDFPSRMAGLIGVSRGSVFDHLAPGLNIFERGYRRWANAPSAQPAELFALISNPRILDAVESIIGPEIWAAPGFYFNFKMAERHRQLRRRSEALARQQGVPKRSVLPPARFIREFQVGQTPWHMDAYPGLGEPGKHNYIVVWVPMTRSDIENGTLRILPSSHLNGYCDFPREREHEAVTIEAQPGDVVIMDGQTFHASLPNRSRERYRWAFNFRYMPPGGLYGRRYLPGFVARSRSNPGSVLNDAELWRQSWEAALDFVSRYELPLKHNFFMTAEETRQLDDRWQQLVPDHAAWLELHRKGNIWKAAWCSLRKMIDRAYGRVLYFKEQRGR